MTIRKYFNDKLARIETFLDRMEYEGEMIDILEKYDSSDIKGLMDWAEENGVDLTATTRNGELILDKWATAQE